jgi:hypothetical protein
VNAGILHVLQNAEQKAVFESYNERRKYEKKVRDPDDCYLEVLQRKKERRDRGLPPMIGILRGTRRATSEEILSDILDDRHEQEGKVEESDEVEPNVTARSGPECAMMPNSDAEFRRRLIDRVNTLRVAAGMSKEEFFATARSSCGQQLGQIVAADENEAWEHLSIETLDRVAGAFDIGGADSLRFKR